MNRIDLKYHFDEDQGALYAEVKFGKLAQGLPGHAHGGAISAVFDELMGACCWVNRYPAMTANYKTQFIIPVPLRKTILYVARITSMKAQKIKLKASMVDVSQVCYADAQGLFIMTDLTTFKEMDTQVTKQEDGSMDSQT